jgi:hypothetical protein
MPSPDKALYDLLLSLFTPAELQRLLTHEYGREMVASLPFGGTPSDLAFAAAQQLRRSGLIAPQLFLALVTAAPGRHRDIAAVAQAFGFSPPPLATSAASASPTPAAGQRANTGGGCSRRGIRGHRRQHVVHQQWRVLRIRRPTVFALSEVRRVHPARAEEISSGCPPGPSAIRGGPSDRIPA